MTRDYNNLYKVDMLECARGGFCSSHVCSQGAKANPLSAVLPALYKQKNFELRPLCNVIKVNTDSTGKKATGVTYIDARGNEVEQPADIVVLATYCFNNTRLLLLSGIGKPYDPQTGKGVVGRNYSYQVGGRVHLFFDDNEFNPFIGGGQINTSIDELNGDLIDRGPLGFVGGAYVNTRPGASPIKGKPLPHGTPRWGGEWKKAVAHNYRRTIRSHSRLVHELSPPLPRSRPDLQRRQRPAAAAHDVRLARERAEHAEVDVREVIDIAKACNGSRRRHEQGHAFRDHRTRARTTSAAP